MGVFKEKGELENNSVSLSCIRLGSELNLKYCKYIPNFFKKKKVCSPYIDKIVNYIPRDKCSVLQSSEQDARNSNEKVVIFSVESNYESFKLGEEEYSVRK